MILTYKSTIKAKHKFFSTIYNNIKKSQSHGACLIGTHIRQWFVTKFGNNMSYSSTHGR